MPLVIDPLAHLLRCHIRLVWRPAWRPQTYSFILLIIFGKFNDEEVEALVHACAATHVYPTRPLDSFFEPGAVHIATAGFQHPDDRLRTSAEWSGIAKYLDLPYASMYEAYILKTGLIL